MESRKKLKLPRGKMPPPMKIHKDKKKEENKKRCRKPTITSYWESILEDWNKMIGGE